LSGWPLNQLNSPSFAWRTKTLLLTDQSRGGLFLLVKGYFAGIFCIEKQGLAMRWGKGGGAAAALT